MSNVASEQVPDEAGRFGPYGGRYVPETLVHPLQQLEEEYFRAQQDPEFQQELDYYLREFCGRPTPLYFAQRLTEDLGGMAIDEIFELTKIDRWFLVQIQQIVDCEEELASTSPSE